jgi:hypothetical protein
MRKPGARLPVFHGEREDAVTWAPHLSPEKALGEIPADAHPTIRQAYLKHVQICVTHNSPIVPWEQYAGEMEAYPDLVEDAKHTGERRKEETKGRSSLLNK